MKRLFTPNKFFIAVIFFCLGFLTNHLLVKERSSERMAINFEGSNEERFPVDPADFDQRSMLDTLRRMSEESDSISGMGELAGVSQREDEKFVYYEIPLKGQDGNNHKLNVEIKEGMIRISEDVKSTKDSLIETSSERMFSIDPNLDADKAEVINEKEKIVIKIPKK